DQICSSHHERFPLADSNLDHFSGMINARDVLSQWLKTRTLDLTICMYTPHTVPENKTALDLLDDFRSSGIHAALVLDEYGAVKGMVTVSDILALVVGQLREPGEDLRWEAIKCDDNSWLIDALMPVSEFRRLFALSETANSWYQTAGGLVLNNLRHIPKEGEYFELDGFKIEVIDMDGNRIDKLLVRPLKMQD
ncbi:MAG: CBS domain-containing protein, partial [Candidatus Obscuribacterales bacterium]|nr:CBS domain-containing protein [Candidatus Obscuribacterales bacterium]